MSLSTFKIELIFDPSNNSRITLGYQNGYNQCADILLFSFEQNDNRISLLDYEAKEFIDYQLLQCDTLGLGECVENFWTWEDGTVAFSKINQGFFTFKDRNDENNKVVVSLAAIKELAEKFKTYNVNYIAEE